MPCPPPESDDYTTPFPLCPICGAEMERVDCWYGCDEGFFDEYDTDAINYSPGEEYRACPECAGQGSYWECPNVPHAEEETTDAIEDSGHDGNSTPGSGVRSDRGP